MMDTHSLRTAWATAALAALCIPTASIAAAPSPRTTVALAQGWQFKLGDTIASPQQSIDTSGWQSVSVPHSWNRVGYYIPDPDKHVNRAGNVNKTQGIGWYRLTFGAPPVAHGQRAWLQFDAASRKAEVWLNGVRLGEHLGGFSRFRFDATAAIHSGRPNELVVKVDNSEPKLGSATADTLPLVGDFFVRGGLYRPVALILTDSVHFDLLDFGGPGVYARTTAIIGGTAALSVRSRLRNDMAEPATVKLLTKLIDAQGKSVAEAAQTVTVAAHGEESPGQALTVARARLWQGTADPYLYTLRTEIRSASGQLRDAIDQPFGIRQIRLDPANGLFLNGKHLALHGVGLHQDQEGKDWALTPDDIARSVAILREMGANTIRLTHYQHGQPVHDLADRSGLILWDEIPLVTAWTLDAAQKEAPPALLANARQQLAELILQNYNHPSVAVWGIANEVDFGASRPDFLGKAPAVVPDPMALLRELDQLAKATDPSRPTVLANCCEDRQADAPVTAEATDAFGVNRYFGWYYGVVGDLGAHLDTLHGKRPGQPMAVTEYGAGAATTIHTDDVRGGPVDAGGRDQPEEYQAWVHEQTWHVLQTKP
jgi:beta-galactosidase